MKNTVVKFFMTVLLFNSFLSCDNIYMDRFYTIIVENNADYKIGYYAAVPGTVHTYPDTQISPTQSVIPVSPNSNGYGLKSSNSWEYNVKQLPSDTLSIFIFHWDTIENFTWQEIRDDYKVLKRYDLSIEDLQALDFKVPYPPTAAMEGMQMYPPE